MNKTALLIFTVSAAALINTAADDDVLAVVNGVSIPESRLLLYAQNAEVNDINRDAIINNIITGEVITQAAKNSGIAERPDIREQMAVAEQNILGRAYVDDFFARNPVDEARINSRYEELTAEADGKSEYNIAHILVAEEATATELLEKLKDDPALFAALATENSQDPSSAANGGALGWLVPEALVAPFATAMTELEEGELSEPVQTEFGWHIIRVDGQRTLQVPPLTDELRQRIEQGERAEQFAKHVEQLRGAATIER